LCTEANEIMRDAQKKKCLSPCARIVGLASSVPSMLLRSSMIAVVGFVTAGPCGVPAACQLGPPSSTRAVVCFFQPLLQQSSSNGLAALRPLPRSAARRSTAAATSAAAAATSCSSGLRMVAERQEGVRVGLAAAADMSLLWSGVVAFSQQPFDIPCQHHGGSCALRCAAADDDDNES
jgi:hypothetical protein